MNYAVLALIAAAPVAAQAPRPAPQPITITVTDQGYTPRVVTLRAGQPYVLRVVNRGDKGHNLTQKAFFERAEVDPADRPVVGGGTITLPAHERAVVHFVAPYARPGATFQFSSTVLADAGSDFKGTFRIR